MHGRSDESVRDQADQTNAPADQSAPADPATGQAATSHATSDMTGSAARDGLLSIQGGPAAQAGQTHNQTAQTAAQNAAAAAALPPGLEPDVDQLAARTVRWQNLGVLDQGGTARIRLSPPELGSVQVALQTVDNVVHVQLTVESESVRQLLQSHSDRLVQSLQSHGLTAANVQVSIETPSGRLNEQDTRDGGQGQGQGQDPQDTGQQPRQGGRDETFQQRQEELNLTA
jgi:flagellar hook-length control protein FliK